MTNAEKLVEARDRAVELLEQAAAEIGTLDALDLPEGTPEQLTVDCSLGRQELLDLIRDVMKALLELEGLLP